ncbi:unnamed protein product [Vicia faba]|uniref:Uncharacterized protein n=1 Tax=Vicia faba TaxID=3906 RepID=A0AAV1ARB7_VICFA|nr:unnamed protein product [Vicia faba]
MLQPTSISSNQHLVHTMSVSLQGNSTSVLMDLSESFMDTNDNVQNGEFIKVENIIMYSQKLQGDLHSFGITIKQHEDSTIILGGSSNHVLDKITMSRSIDECAVVLGGFKFPLGNINGNTSSTLQLCHILKHNKQFNSPQVQSKIV